MISCGGNHNRVGATRDATHYCGWCSYGAHGRVTTPSACTAHLVCGDNFLAARAVNKMSLAWTNVAPLFGTYKRWHCSSGLNALCIHLESDIILLVEEKKLVLFTVVLRQGFLAC